jgi:RNA polymerase sigma-70 factor (ECF subfamily)
MAYWHCFDPYRIEGEEALRGDSDPRTGPRGPAARNFSQSSRVDLSGAVVNDDAQLIDEAVAGRSVAFGQLVTKYQDRLYNALVHVIGSADEARDVVQDAFVQAFLKLSSFHRTSAFYTWLYRIAFNVAISRRRRRKPMVSVEQSREASGQEPTARDAAPSDRLERQERVAQVQSALAAMSEEHRAVLVLREMDGLCYETIAEVLDLPVGTVRSRLHRARLELREQLKEVLQEEEL